MTFATQHARAFSQIKAKGAECIITREASTYDAATDTTTDGDQYIHGHAVRVMGDPDRYEGLGLVEQHPATLMFVAESYLNDPLPRPGDSVWWNRTTYTIRHVEPIAPDGTAIISELVVVR